MANEHQEFLWELREELLKKLRIDLLRTSSFSYISQNRRTIDKIADVLSMWQKPSDGYTNEDYRAFALHYIELLMHVAESDTYALRSLTQLPWRAAASILSDTPGLPYLFPKERQDILSFEDITVQSILHDHSKIKLQNTSATPGNITERDGIYKFLNQSILKDNSDAGTEQHSPYILTAYARPEDFKVSTRNEYTSQRYLTNLAKGFILSNDTYQNMTLGEYMDSDAFIEDIENPEVRLDIAQDMSKRFIERSYSDLTAPPFLLLNDYRPAPKSLYPLLHDMPLRDLRSMYEYVATTKRSHPKTSSVKYTKELLDLAQGENSAEDTVDLTPYMLPSGDAKRDMLFKILQKISFAGLRNYREMRIVSNIISEGYFTQEVASTRTPEEAFAFLNVMYDGDGRHFEQFTALEILDILTVFADYRRGFATARSSSEFFEELLKAVLLDDVPREAIMHIIVHIMSDESSLPHDEVPVVNREVLQLLKSDDISPAWFLSATERRKRSINKRISR